MFRCKVCGWLHAGETPPDTCPSCGSPADRFRPVVDGLGGPSDASGQAMTGLRLRLLALVPATIDSPFARHAGSRLDVVTGDAAWFDDNIPCMRACPVNTDVATYIGHVAGGAFGLAAALNRDQNLFSGTLGRTCSRPCEDACRRTVIDDPIQIRALKRVAIDHAPARHPDARADHPAPASVPATGRRVAVVGAGVAGLTTARDLRAAGHGVTVFERDDHPGGLMLTGVPAWRLPRDVIVADIASMTSLGIEIRTGQALGADLTVGRLSREHDAVVIATGAQAAVGLPRVRISPPGEEAHAGVIDGLSFLAMASRGEQHLHGPVVVIGGGYTAFDCARSARRLGRGPVTIAMRQAVGTAALTDELTDAIAEGIDVRTGVSLDAIDRDPAGRAKGVSLRKSDGSSVDLPCALVIAALGQEPDWSVLDPPPGTPRTSQTSRPNEETGRLMGWPNVWLAGDVLTGSTSFIEAIASARRTARTIDQWLGASRPTAAPFLAPPAVVELPLEDQSPTDDISMDRGGVPMWTADLLRRRLIEGDPYRNTPRQETRVRDMGDRGLASGDVSVEVDLGLTAEIGHLEAARCLQCQANIHIDGDRCILCNGCVDVCPYGCIEMLTLDRLATVDGRSPEPTTARHAPVAMVIDEDACIRCGKCVDWCPTGCLTMSAHRPTLGGVPHGFDVRSLLTE